MKLALIVIVGVVGVLVTALAGWRTWQAARRGAPRELQIGYLALMVLVGVVSLLLLRLA